jgi:hypothetical protein
LYHLKPDQVLLMDHLRHPCLQKINYIRTSFHKKGWKLKNLVTSKYYISIRQTESMLAGY